MRNDYFRYYHPKLLIPLLVFLGVIFYLGNSYFDSHWGVSLSITAVITSLLILIDKYLWKYKPFCYLFWSINLQGRYEGVIEYCDPITGSVVEKMTTIEISQTGSSIKIQSFFGEGNNGEKSMSRSLDTSLIRDDHNEYSIVFTYLNGGNITMNFPPHYGTNIFRVLNSKDKVTGLRGEYYTNRCPIQTKGTIQVDYKTRVLNQG